MSYDVMVFEPSVAPTTHSEFLEWYTEQTQWAEDHGYDDPNITLPRLQAWFKDVIQAFPPMNGPLTLTDEQIDLMVDASALTDYSIGRTIIYAAFASSKVELAYQATFESAAKHGVGFFDVSSSESKVWMPIDGTLVLSHQGTADLTVLLPQMT